MSQQQRYALLSESIPVGIVFQEPTGEVVEANAAALRILDVPKVEALGRSLASLLENAVDEEGQAIPVAQHPPCIALRTRRDVPARVIGLVSTQCPEPVWIRTRSFPLIDTNGSVVEICTTLEDINDVKRLRELLQESQTQEVAGTVTGKFAHEFNNMLTVVAGHAQLLESRLHDDPEALAELREIMSVTKCATALTRQLQVLGRRQRVTAKTRVTPDQVARIA